MKFRCQGCGICCKNITETNEEGEELVSKKIPIYPEEADRLEAIADLRNVDDLKILEDFVIADKKSQRILVVRYKYVERSAILRFSILILENARYTKADRLYAEATRLP